MAGLAAAATAIVLLVASDAGSHPWALFLFAFAAFALVALGGEFRRAGVARRRLTGEPFPRALARAFARNRRRYGGYIVHSGIALLLIGIAASSSFQTNRDVRLAVGESAEVGDYTLTYERLTADPKNERISFAASLDVTRDGKPFATLNPARNYYPTEDPSAGPIGRYFMGESTSEVGIEPGAGETCGRRSSPISRCSTRTSSGAIGSSPGFRRRARGSRSSPWRRSTPRIRRRRPSG